MKTAITATHGDQPGRRADVLASRMTSISAACGLALLVVGCTDGASTSADRVELDDQVPDQMDVQQAGNGFNAPLSGTVSYGGIRLDLDTGVETELFLPRPAVLGDVTVSTDGRTSLEVFEGCARQSVGANPLKADCVIVRDNESGQETARVVVDGSISTARLSRDGQLIAMDVTYAGGPRFPGSTFGTYGQLILARASTGELLTVERLREQRRSMSRFHWTPEGSILYTIDNPFSELLDSRIMRIADPLTDPPESDELIADLDDFGLEGGVDAGGILNFDLSPDGSTLAFEWLANRVYVLYTMDIASRDVRPLADAGFLGRFRHPVFSPDGQWIAASIAGVPSLISSVAPLSSASVALRLDDAPYSVTVDGRVEDDGVHFIRTVCERSCDDEEAGVDYLRSRFLNSWIE